MNKKLRFMALSAVIAAVYAALSLIFYPISYLGVQVRISEVLTVLPYFTFTAVPGLTLGCFIANIVSPLGIWDMIIGTLATLIAAIATYLLRKVRFGRYLAPLPPVIVNAVIIGLLEAYYVTGSFAAENFTAAFYTAFLYVGAGQTVSCYVLGLVLQTALLKYKNKLNFLK